MEERVPESLLFEALLRKRDALNFKLDFRIALVDGQICENKSISVDAFNWLDDACNLYRQSDEAARRQIREMFDSDDMLWHLFIYIDRLLGTAKPIDGILWEKALIALSIEDGRFDQRDSLLTLQKLLRRSTSSKFDAREVLLRVAELSSASMRPVFLNTANQIL